MEKLKIGSKKHRSYFGSNAPTPRSQKGRAVKLADNLLIGETKGIKGKIKYNKIK